MIARADEAVVADDVDGGGVGRRIEVATYGQVRQVLDDRHHFVGLLWAVEVEMGVDYMLYDAVVADAFDNEK